MNLEDKLILFWAYLRREEVDSIWEEKFLVGSEILEKKGLLIYLSKPFVLGDASQYKKKKIHPH